MIHRHIYSIVLATVLLLAATAYLSGQDAGALDEKAAADPLLEEARSLASEGKLKDAAAAYTQWLAENGGHPSFGIILIEAADFQLSIERALELLRIYTPRVQDARQREICRASQIDLLEMLGRTEQALSLLRSFPPTPHWLYRQAHLLYQQGLTEEAQKSLGQALKALLSDESADSGNGEGEAPDMSEAADASPQELEARIRLLQARIYVLEEKHEEAEKLFRFLGARYGATGVAPGILLAYYEYLMARGRAEEAAIQLQSLAGDFPDSPELALAREAEGEEKIGYAPTPSRMLPRELPLPEPKSQTPSKVPASTAVTKPESRHAEPKPQTQPQTQTQPQAQARTDAPIDRPQPELQQESTSQPQPQPEFTPQPQAQPQPEGPMPQPETPPEPEPQSESRPESQMESQPQTVLVQTGSFRDRENAQYMVRDLKTSGFDAGIVEKQIGGTLYYRVVIGPQMTVEQAQSVLMQLKDASFEGVLLFPE